MREPLQIVDDDHAAVWMCLARDEGRAKLPTFSGLGQFYLNILSLEEQASPARSQQRLSKTKQYV